VDSELRTRLLDDSFRSDSDSDFDVSYQDEDYTSQSRRGKGKAREDNMDWKTGDGAKTTGVETHVSSVGVERHLKSSDGAGASGQGNGTFELAGNGSSAGEGVDGEVLEQAIEALEGKKKSWWAYLLTREFWFVLLLG
jgi:hypothetical protein